MTRAAWTKSVRKYPLPRNSMQYGTDIMVTAPPFGDFYLLQFTLAGKCQLRQGESCTDMPAGSVAVINPFRAFAKAWAYGLTGGC
jgi:AraC-binding-like domain